MNVRISVVSTAPSCTVPRVGQAEPKYMIVPPLAVDYIYDQARSWIIASNGAHNLAMGPCIKNVIHDKYIK